MTKNDGRTGRGGGPARPQDDIDGGRTKDKVPLSDPAVAPFGAIGEAVGSGPSHAEDDLQRQRRDVANASMPASYTDLWRRSKGLILALVLVAVLVVVLLMTMLGGPSPE